MIVLCWNPQAQRQNFMPEIMCGHLKTAIFHCELSDYQLEWKCVINVEMERGENQTEEYTRCLIMPSNVIDL